MQACRLLVSIDRAARSSDTAPTGPDLHGGEAANTVRFGLTDLPQQVPSVKETMTIALSSDHMLMVY